MIYEMRTTDIKPKFVPEVEKRFGETYERRKQYSELAAFWHTEFGPLNQIIHVWPYQNLEERARIRAAAVKDGTWPPKIKEFIVNQRSDIMIPLSVSPEIKPGKMGPCFEMRIYTYAPGELPKLMNLWEMAAPRRIQISPLCAAWYSELGGLNKFVHIWPYPSLDAHNDARGKAQAAGVWPPSAKKLGTPEYQLTAQENKIVMPASF